MPEDTKPSTYCLVATCSAVVGFCVTATDVRPPKVRAVPPRLIEVVPSVIEEFCSAPLGIEEKFVPVNAGAVL